LALVAVLGALAVSDPHAILGPGPGRPPARSTHAPVALGFAATPGLRAAASRADGPSRVPAASLVSALDMAGASLANHPAWGASAATTTLVVAENDSLHVVDPGAPGAMIAPLDHPVAPLPARRPKHGRLRDALAALDERGLAPDLAIADIAGPAQTAPTSGSAQAHVSNAVAPASDAAPGLLPTPNVADHASLPKPTDAIDGKDDHIAIGMASEALHFANQPGVLSSTAEAGEWNGAPATAMGVGYTLPGGVGRINAEGVTYMAGMSSLATMPKTFATMPKTFGVSAVASIPLN
jgi:hypothetical protein